VCPICIELSHGKFVELSFLFPISGYIWWCKNTNCRPQSKHLKNIGEIGYYGVKGDERLQPSCVPEDNMTKH
jgi:hypothetical protein